MSKVVTNAVVLGQSGTDTNNFLLDIDGAGALRIRRKSDGSGGTVLTVNSAGTLLQPAQSMVRLNTANGYGSTNTKIRRFTNVVTNQGTDITYADSATLGASFTINTAGVYAIAYGDNFTTAAYMGVSLNTASPTTNINALSASEILISSYQSTADTPLAAPWTGYLAAGSVVRAHTSGVATGTQAANQQFTITRVS